VSLSERFEESVGRGNFEGQSRRQIISELEDLMSSEYSQRSSRAGFEVKGLYKLYLDICYEMGERPGLVYTGSDVIREDRLEELASEKGVDVEQVVNELEVEI